MPDTRLITGIITDYREADFLKNAEVFAVDIETETETDDDMWEKSDKFGLSFNAPISHISFFDGINPAVVLTVPHPEPGSPECSDPDMIKFIQDIFLRDGYTVVAHNAVFDMRNLGGTFDFLIPHGSNVWDTQAIAVRSTIADGFDETRGAPSTNHQPSKLEALIELFNLVPDPLDADFLSFMKDQRRVLSEMDTILQQIAEDPDHIVWSYANYYGELSPTSDWVISQYVASDTIATFYLYEEQQRIIELVGYSSENILHTINETTKIFTWPELPELIALEQRISRISSNQAIRGTALDVSYVVENHTRLQREHDRLYEEVHAEDDPTHTLDQAEWRTTFFMLAWYQMMIEGVQKTSGKYNPIKKFDDRWPIDWTREFDHKHLAASLEGENQTEWFNWLLSLNYDDTPYHIRKTRPKSDPPSLNLEKWVENTTEIDEENALVRWFKGWLKYDYYRRYVFGKKGNEAVTAFAQYYIFTICNLPLPQDDDLKYLADLRTGSWKRVFPDYLQEDNLLIKTLIAINRDDVIPSRKNVPDTCRKMPLFSISKKAVAFLIRRKFELAEKEDLHEFQSPSATFWRMLETDALLRGTIEFVKHGERDDRIHSLMSRLTRTGRFSSQQPNIQNIKMAAYKGYLVGDPHSELFEFDYSNAENKMAATIAADNKFASLTEEKDMHTEMAKIYKPIESAAALEESYAAFKARLRNPLKPVTFSIAYGGGPSKIAEILASDIHTARDLINRRKEAFPVTEKKKDDMARKVNDQLQRGWHTPIVRLWDGSRIRVPVYGHGRTRQAKTHALWNYANQGSVAQMVVRAMVLIDDYLYENDCESYIALNVHDSLIITMFDQDYPHVPIEVCRIMNSIVPDAFLRRTTPRVHQVAEIGPENAKKWGWRSGYKYLFPTDEFINAWGVHPLPEGEEEAPTWLGPVDEGWTLKQETIDIARGVTERIGLPKENEEMPDEVPPWEELNPYESQYFEEIVQAAQAIGEGMRGLLEIAEEAEKAITVTVPTGAGNESMTATDLTSRMALLWALAAAGKETPQYIRFRAEIKRLLENMEVFTDLAENAEAFIGTYGDDW